MKKYFLFLLIFFSGLVGCSANENAKPVASLLETVSSTKETQPAQPKMDFSDAVNQLIVESSGEVIEIEVTPDEVSDVLTVKLQNAFLEKSATEQLRITEAYQTWILDAYELFYLPEHPGKRFIAVTYITESQQVIAISDPNQEDPRQLVLMN